MIPGLSLDWTLGLQTGLFFSAALLGLAGGLHCVGMCGAAGAALCGGGTKPAFRWWNVARVASYAVAGAMVGGGAQWLLNLSSRWPALQAVWVMLQFAALAVALLMLLAPRVAGWKALAGNQGWMPVTLGAVGHMLNRESALVAGPVVAGSVGAGSVGAVGGQVPASSAGKPHKSVSVISEGRGMKASWGALTGLLWAGLPCGLLHGALLMAWMSGSAAAGAFIMVLFGSASAAWLMAGAGLVQRLKASGAWSEIRLRRLTGAVLLLSWLAMASGLSSGWWGAGASPGCQPAVKYPLSKQSFPARHT